MTRCHGQSHREHLSEMANAFISHAAQTRAVILGVLLLLARLLTYATGSSALSSGCARVHTALPLNNEVKPPCRTPQGLQRAVPHSTISSFSEEDEHYEMAQAYHSVPLSIEHEVVEDGRETEHEGSALLGSRASGIGLVKSETQREGHATLTSCVGNLANTIIGSGACAVFLSPQFCRRRRISRSNDARS